MSTTLPGGLGQLAATTTTAWSNPLDPLSIASAAATATYNGASTTTTVSGDTVTTTTPGGRTITTAIDGQGRPTTIQSPGLPPVNVTYDHGRVAQIEQGGRSLTYGYSGAFLHTVTDTLNRTLTVSTDAAGSLTQSQSA